MRGPQHWAVAVRLPDRHPTDPGGIAIVDAPAESVLARHPILRKPVIRGAVALVESMAIGIRALGIAANAQTPDGEAKPLTGLAWALTITAGLSLAVGLFFLLPATLVKLIAGSHLAGNVEFVAVEKVTRLTIFIGYVWLVSRMAHLQRVFAYHGAEHQSIACLEAGQPLTPEHAARFSRLHPRCGTSFMLIVMVVSFGVFVPLGNLPLGWLLLSRLFGIPLVAGLSFEVIKWMGRHRELRFARILMWPGMQLQRLTTREPSRDQLEVAIAALQRVLAHGDPRQAPAAQRAGLDLAA